MKKTTTSQPALASQNDLRGAVAGAWGVVGWWCQTTATA